MKKNKFFLILVLMCVYSIVYACTAANVSALSISGRVSGVVQDNVSISRTEVTCGDTSSVTVETWSDGFFYFFQVPNGNYIVKPQKTGYIFSPKQRSVTINYNPATGVDFIADFIRFVDNGDGTVTDLRTNLIWLKDAACFGGTWSHTSGLVAGLNSGECGLSDGSLEGDWRLPTKDELQGIGTNPPATWTDGLPSETWTIPDAPFTDVETWYYWTSEGLVDNIYGAWAVALFNGYTIGSYIEDSFYVWPVR